MGFTLYRYLLFAGALVLATIFPTGLAQITPQIGTVGDSTETTNGLPVGVNITALEADLAVLADTSFDEAALGGIEENLRLAIARLESANTYQSLSEQFGQNTQNHTQIMDTLNRQLSEARARLDAPLAEDEMELGETSLNVMEQQLRELEGQQNTVEGELLIVQQRLSALSGREDLARAERQDSEQALTAINAQIASLSGGVSGGVDDLAAQAMRKRLFAHRYARAAERNALDREIVNIPLLTGQLNLAAQIHRARLLDLGARLDSLRDKTGLLRSLEADQLMMAAREDVARAGEAHPLVLAIAEQNLNYAQSISDIARSGENLSVVQARLNLDLQQVQEDYALAEQIASENNIDRKYGAVLRRLREAIPDRGQLQKEIQTRRRTKLDVSMERILAQDRLKEINFGRFDIPITFADWFENNPDAAELSAVDETMLRNLYARQRELVNEVIDIASSKFSQLSEISAAQQSLRERSQELQALLDQRLLWLPSTAPLSLDWPRKVIEGAFQVLKPSNFIGAGASFISGLGGHLWITLITLAMLIIDVIMRPKFRERLAQMQHTVGRVQRDSLTNTPIAVLASIVRVLPSCLVGLWGGYILYASEETRFSLNLGLAIMGVSVLCFGLLTIKDWSRDGRLFDLHFGVDRYLRHRLSANISWFALMQSTALMTLMLCAAVNGEAANDGLAIFGFLVGTLSLAFFIYRMLIAPSSRSERFVSPLSYIGRHRKIIFGLIFALPCLTSLLAVSGYFATAQEVHVRLVLTTGLIILAYVIYGVISRSVLVMQRQLALEQLRQKREQTLKERRERDEAEERGEALDMSLPDIEYEKIDIETISRQSRQLLNIVGLIIIGALAWILWADLLPALSVFNEVKLPFNKMSANIEGEMQAVSATLWDLIKALFTGLVTFIAAKNLPGFLDLFVLKRSGITAGSRYAITTVLGYVIIIIGILIVSDHLGIEWSNLQWIIAALGVGIGFGLQEIIANFISGLIILFERPVRLGDYVTIGDQSGHITRIQIRATTLADLDNREILIPNRELIAGRVTNWTLSNSTLRLVVPVGIAYGSDTAKAQALILKTVKDIPGILDMPEPQVFFIGFGDSSLNFEIRCFLANLNLRFPIKHDVHSRVNKALEDANIAIPFPQRDVRIVNAEPPKATKS